MDDFHEGHHTYYIITIKTTINLMHQTYINKNYVKESHMMIKMLRTNTIQGLTQTHSLMYRIFKSI